MNKKVVIWSIIGIVVLLIAYYLISPAFRVVEVNEPMPTTIGNGNAGVSGLVLARGEFVASAHDVEGEAKLIGLPNEKRILRFENFDTVNGPDLFIYLSADLEANDFINLGEIKGTKGNINYNIPEGTDIEKYNKVLVWCRAFSVLFSYAELS